MSLEWALALIFGALVMVVLYARLAVLRLERIIWVLEHIRREQAYGLGVDNTAPSGILEGGDLNEIVNDVRDRRRKEYEERFGR